MDLHVYRNSQDRWHDLKAAARQRGAVLALNAVTLTELIQRLTPDVTTPTPGQCLAILRSAADNTFPNSLRYAYDAVTDLKGSRVRPDELRAAGAEFLAEVLTHY